MSYGDDTTVIARTVATITLPLVLVVAIALLFQGHNLPGGGFIAGVLTAAAFALVYVVFGVQYVQETTFGDEYDPDGSVAGPAVVDRYRTLFGVGVAVAAGTGAGAMAFGKPFLTHTDEVVTPSTEYVAWIPGADFIFGTLFEFHWATAFLFDIGVYFVVVGGLLAILTVVGSE
jgi:multicomponent Na+:H+ antiporter subunit B